MQTWTLEQDSFTPTSQAKAGEITIQAVQLPSVMADKITVPPSASSSRHLSRTMAPSNF